MQCQSKHCLMESSEKKGKFLSKESQEQKTCTFLGSTIKMPFGMLHPLHLHIIPSLCVQEGSGVTNLQVQFNYLDLFMFISSGVLRGKEFSNRIKLS